MDFRGRRFRRRCRRRRVRRIVRVFFGKFSGFREPQLSVVEPRLVVVLRVTQTLKVVPK